MFREMGNMKDEMRIMQKSMQQSQMNQNNERPGNDKSSLVIRDNNSNSFNLNRSRQLSENQPLHQSSLFFAGGQNEANANNRHFGGTRYNSGA